jgi:transcriptional regulator with XRE-family HTH domain
MSVEFFAKKAKELRESKKISMRKLSKIFGVSHAIISYYESCKREPTLSALESYSKYFNISLDDLVGTDWR